MRQQSSPTASSAGLRCQEPGCGGTVQPDGFCDECGTAPSPASAPGTPGSGPSVLSASSLSASSRQQPSPQAPVSSSSTPSLASSRASRAGRTRGSKPARPSVRRLGAGLVQVPETTMPDPALLVQANPVVPENKRFCHRCEKPVGRSRQGRPGRTTGFCAHCQQPFSFASGLRPGDRIGPPVSSSDRTPRYEVMGAIAHGGQGWIYLALDHSVEGLRVVLKGLLDAGDAGARAAAIAERRFLASVDHPTIVKIHTFVEHAGTGYIVMEYVGGTSLRELLKRRRAARGQPDPLPVAEAISYLLAVLPAFAYLHRNGLLFCDFKPDNVMLGQDTLKLIDLGAVRRADDVSSDVYGTPGYQAPEVGDQFPSVASDLYTLGRTLAVLILDFRGNTSTYKHSLPPPDDHPPLRRYDSLHRFLLKATASSPDDRFASADEMHDELLGVLREVVAAERGTPAPAPSRRFTGDTHPTGENPDGSRAGPAASVLPALRVDPDDPAASTLAALPDADPATLAELLAAIQPVTVEVRLRLARAQLEAGRYEQARRTLDAIEDEDPWDWRVGYYRGLVALADGDVATARAEFDGVYSEAPGELAPKLALALAAEVDGDTRYAERMYDVVSSTDDSFTSAAFGLARVRTAAGDRQGAADAYRQVPPTSAAYLDAQVRLARLLGTVTAAGSPDGAGLIEASAILGRLDLDPARRVALERDLLAAAVDLVGSGAVAPDDTVTVVGRALHGEDLRFGLEAAYRELARLAPTVDDRYFYVDEANRIRPRTLT
ncbi:serine/threonine-protein kinase [Candidatus Protofrankia datiscae]|uniref:non-specific serine/threonine protein kinase n=1 Tax=Candidatus Protofrankia datiscae TaxID=2716812 RepID=F8B5S3_9ACTN|nr:serine/threonine-protein kinase [Candidatus Protofrankia datiscae]AEH10161.1 serine/threonine protein kinase [Candidatus Protofrankia datiscae]